jgi:hypothetical protein
MTDLASRCALLTAALGFALLDTRGKPAPAGRLTMFQPGRRMPLARIQPMWKA